MVTHAAVGKRKLGLYMLLFGSQLCLYMLLSGKTVKVIHATVVKGSFVTNVTVGKSI